MFSRAGAKGTVKQAGFSLVELMVVVAIIGVLATIAIPRVNRFIAKSRQSEAQVNLSSLYTFNKNFFVEFQGYTSDFQAMGFKPEGNLRYNVGWSQATGSGPANYTTLKGGTYGGPVQTLGDCAAHVDRCTMLMGANNALPATTITGASIDGSFQLFTAGAISNLIPAIVDQWTISENKRLVNVVDGTVETD